MSENWTKGPWRVRDERIVGADGQTIRMSGVALPCGYVPKNDESFSNMNLAAAAPEMYALLERVKDELVYHLSFSENAKLAVKAESFGVEIFSLLKKARGES